MSGAPLNRLIAGPGGTPKSKPLRFVITQENFQPLKGVLSSEEIEDTKVLIEELRRRIGIITQIDSLETRSNHWKELAGEFDELYLSVLLLQVPNPTGALNDISKKRALFNKLETRRKSWVQLMQNWMCKE